MTTNFPSSVDAFTNPTSNDTLDNPPHDQQHADINDAMEAVQTSLLDGSPLRIDDANNRVGVNDATPSYTLDVNGDINTTGVMRVNGDVHGGNLLAASTTGSADVSVSTTVTTVLTMSFTLTENTIVGLGFRIGEVDSFSNNPMYFGAALQDSTNTQQYCYQMIDRGQGWGTILPPTSFNGYVPLTTGTYSFNLRCFTSTGTARIDNASVRHTTMFAINLGGY